MRKYLVTGGAGFIGSSLIRELLKDKSNNIVMLDAITYSGRRENFSDLTDNSSFTFIEGNICDDQFCHQLILDTKPDGIINIAAETHVDRSIGSPDVFIQTNILGTQNLLKIALEHWQTLTSGQQEKFRFVQVSTDEVYGSIDIGEVDEGSSFRPNSPYAASKASADLIVRSYNRTYGLPTIVTQGSNTYGPRQFPEKLVPLIILRALSGLSLPIYGDGKNVREWLHVDDHARGIYLALLNGIPGHHYNLGSTNRITNTEMVILLIEALKPFIEGKNKDQLINSIEYVPDRPGHDLRYSMNSIKSRQELGWRVSRGLNDGLLSTVEWYLENKDWWKPITDNNYSLTRLGSMEG